MLAKIPFWVVPLFLALLAIGWRQTRDRQVAPRTTATVALAMLGLSLQGVVAAAHSAGAAALVVALLAWAAGVAVSVTLGGAVFGLHGLAPATGRPGMLHVPGSPVPLVLMMGIFLAKFALGAATAMHVPAVQQPGFLAAASLLFGALSGGFTRRALDMRRFAAAQDTGAGTGTAAGTINAATARAAA